MQSVKPTSWNFQNALNPHHCFFQTKEIADRYTCWWNITLGEELDCLLNINAPMLQVLVTIASQSSMSADPLEHKLCNSYSCWISRHQVPLSSFLPDIYSIQLLNRNFISGNKTKTAKNWKNTPKTKKIFNTFDIKKNKRAEKGLIYSRL